MFTKQLCVFNMKSAFKKCGIFYRTNQISSNKLIREFSSKKSKSKKKNTDKITVTANNEFVTHQLNTSIAAHLRRQQAIWKNVREEERQQYEQCYRQEKSYQKRTWTENYTFDKNRRNNHRRDHEVSSINKSHSVQKVIGNHFSGRSVQSVELNEDDSSGVDSDDFGIEKLETPNWNEIELSDINKYFYEPSVTTQSRNTKEIEEFRMTSHIQVSSNVENPIFKFNELNISKSILELLEAQGFIECTSIQAQGIPIALSGANMLAVSQSGYESFE